MFETSEIGFLQKIFGKKFKHINTPLLTVCRDYIYRIFQRCSQHTSGGVKFFWWSKVVQNEYKGSVLILSLGIPSYHGHDVFFIKIPKQTKECFPDFYFEFWGLEIHVLFQNKNFKTRYPLKSCIVW